MNKKLNEITTQHPDYVIKCIESNQRAKTPDDNGTVFDIIVNHKQKQIWLWFLQQQ